MKRVISIVLLMVALTSVTACGGDSDKSSMSSSTAQESSTSGIELPADKFN